MANKGEAGHFFLACCRMYRNHTVLVSIRQYANATSADYITDRSGRVIRILAVSGFAVHAPLIWRLSACAGGWLCAAAGREFYDSQTSSHWDLYSPEEVLLSSSIDPRIAQYMTSGGVLNNPSSCLFEW